MEMTTASKILSVMDKITINRITQKEKLGTAGTDIKSEDFVENLEFYAESGVFSHAIDFIYEITGDQLYIRIGSRNPFTDVIYISATVNDLEGVAAGLTLKGDSLSE